MKKLVLLGAGGHCESILDSVLATNEFENIVIVDLKENVGKFVQGCPIVGTDEDLDHLHWQGYSYAFISVGSIKNTALRRTLWKKAVDFGYKIINILDLSANIASSAKLGKGIYVGKNAIINANVVIGDMVIINTAAIVEHNCVVGEFSHIAVGAILCGSVEVGNDCFVGANATIIQERKIPSYSIIGAGEIVKHDLNCKSKIVGDRI